MIIPKGERRTQSMSSQAVERWRCGTSSTTTAWSFLPSSQLAPFYWVHYHAHRWITHQSSRSDWKKGTISIIFGRIKMAHFFFLFFLFFRHFGKQQICILSSLLRRCLSPCARLLVFINQKERKTLSSVFLIPSFFWTGQFCVVSQ